MGRNNKERRAAKRRKKGNGRGAPPRAARETRRQEAPALDELLRAVIFAEPLDTPGLDRVVPLLIPHGEALRSALRRWLDKLLDTLWTIGWTPADIVRVVARECGELHAELAAQVVVADGRRRVADGQELHPRWRHQLDALEQTGGAGRLPLDVFARAGGLPLELFARTAVELLRQLARLPSILSTLPPPGSVAASAATADGLDERLLAKVRALLVKAESTTFEKEAEALSAKAQELITRHAIAEVMLHASAEVGAPAIRRIPVDDPYADAKASVITAIAGANRCRIVFNTNLGCVTAFGYEPDLDAVELLAASLLAQATSAMVRHGSLRDAYGRSRTRSFRRAFLYGFAERIGQRLQEATDAQVAATDDDRLLPVLAARNDRLEDAVAAAFPHLDHRPTSLGNGAGWAAGHAAADLADLGMPAGRLRAS